MSRGSMGVVAGARSVAAPPPPPPSPPGGPNWSPIADYLIDDVVSFDGRTWRAVAPPARQHAPQGIGDGTTADRKLLLAACSRGFAGGLTVGAGPSAATYHVTTAADSGAGSLRSALESTTPYWIVFDADFDIRFTSEVAAKPNKTIDGRGRTVTIGGRSMMWTGFPGPIQVIRAYLRFTDIWANTANSVPWSIGGTGNAGTANEKGSGDLVYDHHCEFTDIRDSSANTAEVAQMTSRATMDWCKFGPNPGPIVVAKAGGFRSFTGAAGTTITSTAHGYVEGQIISVYSRGGGSGLPAGITSGPYKYYVRNPTANTHEVSLTKTGPVVTTTGSGNGYSIDGTGTAPYMAGKGPHWGVNHAKGTAANPAGDPSTGDSTYASTADAVAGTNSVGYLRPSVTLCNFENMLIRCPDLTACFGHVWNCRNYHWGDPDGGSGIAHEYHDQSEVWDHDNIFRPYVAGDAHYWGTLLPTPATWNSAGGSTWAISPNAGDRVRVQTRPGGSVTNWYHGTTTNLGDGDSTTNETAVERNFTRTDPTWAIPYPYDTQTNEAILEQMILRGAGNVQPWELVA